MAKYVLVENELLVASKLVILGINIKAFTWLDRKLNLYCTGVMYVNK